MTESQAVIDLRAAVAAGGEVRLPTGVLQFASPLVLSHVVNQHFPTSLVGGGSQVTRLDFSQAVPDSTGIMLRIENQWGYRLQGFSVVGSGRANGQTGIGVVSTIPNSNGQYGTISGQAIWDHVNVGAFQTGVKLGDNVNNQATSEIQFNNCAIQQCKVCILGENYNTLDLLFNMLQMGDCETGFVSNGAGYVTVVGGSFSAVRGFCFVFGQCSSATLIECRMEEGCGLAMVGGACTGQQLSLYGCMAHQRAGLANEDTSAWMNGWKSPVVAGGSSRLTVEDCTFLMTAGNLIPSIPWTPIYDAHNCIGGLIRAYGNSCNLDPAKVPFINNHPQPGVRVDAKFNMWTDAGLVFKGWYPDQVQ